jgi:hypothetical protein
MGLPLAARTVLETVEQIPAQVKEKNHMKLICRIAAGVGFALAVLAFIGVNTSTSFAAPPGIKAVICHATGSDGNPFVGIEVGIQDTGLLSNNGHLDANGTPLSGHEEDILLGLSPPNEKSDCEKLPPPPK